MLKTVGFSCLVLATCTANPALIVWFGLQGALVLTLDHIHS